MRAFSEWLNGKWQLNFKNASFGYTQTYADKISHNKQINKNKFIVMVIDYNREILWTNLLFGTKSLGIFC